MLRREDASARLSVLGCAQGTSLHICAKYRHKQSRKVVKQISGKLQRSPKYHFHPSIFFLFTLKFFCLVKYEHKGRSERECRGSKWVVKWSFASSGPATWEENTFIQKTNCSLLKAWMLFFFWKKPDVTFHVLIRLFITSPVFPWVHNSTTMQSRWIVCVWFWICVCCIHTKQLCTWALF